MANSFAIIIIKCLFYFTFVFSEPMKIIFDRWIWLMDEYFQLLYRFTDGMGFIVCA